MDYSFILVIAIIMLSTKVLGLASEKVNMPQVVGALIAGLLLGPSCFGLIGESDFLVKTAEIGVIILMFTAGLDTDVQELKHTGLSAFIIATIGVIVPFLGGAGCYLLFNGEPDSLRMLKAAFIGVILTATSVSITVETLREVGKLKSRVGTAIMAAAVIDDVLGIIVLTVLTGFTDSTVQPVTIFIRIIAYFICLAIVAIVIRKAFAHLRARIWGNHRRIAIYALAFCFILSFVSEHFFGIADITGAYFAGLMLSDHGETRTYVVKRINTMSYMLFSPIFFASIGIKTELAGLDGTLILFAVALTIVAILTKIIGCGIGAFLLLIVNPMDAVWFVIFFICLQQFEGNLIYPKVVGSTIGLPGVWVMTAVTIFSNLFGILGIILGTPIAAVLYTVMRRVTTNRLAARGLSNADLEPGKYPYLESSHYAAGYSKGRPLCAPVLERAAKKKEQGKKPLFPKFKTSKKK